MQVVFNREKGQTRGAGTLLYYSGVSQVANGEIIHNTLVDKFQWHRGAAQRDAAAAHWHGRGPGNREKIIEHHLKTSRDGVKAVEDRVKTIEDGGKLTEDEVKMIENRVKTVEDGGKVIEDGVKTAKDRGKMVEDGVKMIENRVKLSRHRYGAIFFKLDKRPRGGAAASWRRKEKKAHHVGRG